MVSNYKVKDKMRITVCPQAALYVLVFRKFILVSDSVTYSHNLHLVMCAYKSANIPIHSSPLSSELGCQQLSEAAQIMKLLVTR